MRNATLILLVICSGSVSSVKGQLQSSVTTELTSGYVTNTYLDPVLSEWDRSQSSGFARILSTANVNWASGGTRLGTSAGGQLMPFMDDRSMWSGGFIHFNARQRLSSQWSVSAGAGGNRYVTDYNRSMYWLQGNITRLITPFSQIRFGVGSSWRDYQNLDLNDEEYPDESIQSYEFYSFEFEYWPSFRWKLTAAFLGNLDQITAPKDGFSTRAGLSYHFSGGTSLAGQVGFDQFAHQYQILHNGAPGPFSPPGTSTHRVEDRMILSTLQLHYPLGRNIAVNTRVSGLQWFSSEDNNVVNDIQASVGIQFSLRPSSRSRSSLSRFNWRKKGDTSTFSVRYQNEGRLYLIGDFNDWERPGIPLRPKSGNRYKASLELTPGVYNYKLLVIRNGKEVWLELPDDADTVNDGFGGENARIIIRNH